MKTSCLHITNGDGAVELIKASSVEGNVLSWRDTMHGGSFPEGLTLDEVSKVRASYFAGDDLDYDKVLNDFLERNKRLKEADQFDQIILWYEHDLLDQLQILQLLDWFHSTNIERHKLSIICIDRFPGIDNFRGLGQLNSGQIASLLKTATPIINEQLELAKEGWAAFRNANPNKLLDFLKQDLDALPFLKEALYRHLQEYPWTSDGLKRSERQLLQLIGNKVSSPSELFQQSMNLESVFFMGDWNVFSHLTTLNHTQTPLITTQTGVPFIHPRELVSNQKAFKEQVILITEVGKQVLDGSINALDILKRDYHLGGVHINSNHSMWMWNDKMQTLELKT